MNKVEDMELDWVELLGRQKVAAPGNGWDEKLVLRTIDAAIKDVESDWVGECSISTKNIIKHKIYRNYQYIFI